ncbi:hypothetical protein GOP47_0011900 [Adiantum capillus-veneris]|uniref:Uncharacterized protein n=1 Tax=Adiantum capillus-veneris TaxID=13818 RepID=A0A9D4UUW6_ADICA|nr:hypothetical protein GOP47_0011247 [Adiantum capillus-veneris]KAI5073887.1 hypothetical protein GOP47_0011900 [Adiantum capillus-veneris]
MFASSSFPHRPPLPSHGNSSSAWDAANPLPHHTTLLLPNVPSIQLATSSPPQPQVLSNMDPLIAKVLLPEFAEKLKQALSARQQLLQNKSTVPDGAQAFRCSLGRDNEPVGAAPRFSLCLPPPDPQAGDRTGNAKASKGQPSEGPADY